MSIERKEQINESEINIDSLLDNLSRDIWEKFWVEVNQIKELISFKQKKELADLKEELSNILQNENFASSKIEELASEIIKARESIELASKSEREKLIWELNIVSIEDFQNTLETNLPTSLLNSAKNPSKLHHHILWVSLWLSNSIITTVEKLVWIWKWIIKSPYDLYLIISWKWEYPWFKEI